MERYLKTEFKTLTDPMLYSSILHTALVVAVFFAAQNFEPHGAPASDTTTIEFNFVENMAPDISELYTAETLPSTNITEPTATPALEDNKTLADFFEQEKLQQQKIEEEKVLALERERNEKEKLERELFAQEQAKQQQLEQERQERKRYQQQLQADIDAAHSKRAADLRAQSSSNKPNRANAAYTGPYVRLAKSNSRVVGVPLSSGGCPATIITHEMTFSWSAEEVRDYGSRFTCTAEVGAATENTVIKNSSESFGRIGCGPDVSRLSNNILKTYMTAPFMNRQCDNGCTGQLECKNGKWEVKNFEVNDNQWLKKLEKTKPKPSEQYY